MDEKQITALAREYAEEMIKGRLSEELPNCLKNSMLTMNTEYIAEIFQWLLRRYCLVEKEAVRKEYHETCERETYATEHKNELYAELFKMRRLTLESLFPKITKEVEG